MLDNLVKTSSIWHPLDSLNNLVGYVGIKSKNILEDTGLVKPQSFTSMGDYKK